MKKKFFLFMIFTITYDYIISQIVDFKIGEIIEDIITKRKFYRAQLTNRTADYLIINVEPSNDYEKYSDPDIFVSVVNVYNLEKYLSF